MGEYLAAFDDSGGIEALNQWDGTPIAGDHPIVLLATAVIRKDLLTDFEADWNALRARIQVELGCDEPPPIHMRLMWGRDVARRKHRGKRNPYADATFEQKKEWVATAWSIMTHFTRIRYGMGFFSMSLVRADRAADLQRFITHPAHARELEVIKKRSRKIYRRYHIAITSPLLQLLTNSFPFLQEMMRAAGGRHVDVVVDPFNDAHGVDFAEVGEAIKRVSRLDQIDSVARTEGADDLPISQAADVYGFVKFRSELWNRGTIERDLHLVEIVEASRFADFSAANIPHRVRLRYPNWPAASQAIHYLIARNRVAEMDAAFADSVLVDVEAFYERCAFTHRNDAIGTSVLRLEVGGWDEAPPKMPKTPD